MGKIKWKLSFIGFSVRYSHRSCVYRYIGMRLISRRRLRILIIEKRLFSNILNLYRHGKYIVKANKFPRYKFSRCTSLLYSNSIKVKREEAVSKRRLGVRILIKVLT